MGPNSRNLTRFFFQKLACFTKADANIVHCMINTNHSVSYIVSCLENPMDGGAWQAAVHGVAKSRTRLSDFTFTFYFHALEEEMATHSSVLAWRIPGMAGPGGLPSMGSHSQTRLKRLSSSSIYSEQLINICEMKIFESYYFYLLL